MDTTSVPFTPGWMVDAILAVACFVGIVANLLVIYIFVRKPGLRTVSNRFVINLLATNLLSSTILIPLLLSDEIYKQADLSSFNINSDFIDISKNITTRDGKLLLSLDDVMIQPKNSSAENTQQLTFTEDRIKFVDNGVESSLVSSELVFKTDDNFSDIDQKFTTIEENVEIVQKTGTVDIKSTVLCYLSEGMANFVCTASILSVLLIAIDQYFAVVHPLRYHMRIDQFRSIFLIATSWIVSIVIGILGAVTPDKNDSIWNFCSDGNSVDVESRQSDTSVTVRAVYVFFYFICVILVPFAAICIIYFCIYTAAHRNSERMRHTNSGSITINVETYAPVPIAAEDETKSDTTEDGLLLKIDESCYQKHSLETLRKIPINVQDWDDDLAPRADVKKSKSVPDFQTSCDTSCVDYASTIQKSPSLEHVSNNRNLLGNELQKVCIDIVETPRKLSIFDDPSRRGSTSESTNGKDISPIGTPKPRAGSLKSTCSFMNTLRCRISNASVFRYREETRAAKISAFVIVMVLVCYLPYGIALILHSCIPKSRNLTIFDSISLIHLVFASVISPFLFAYRNRRIKRELRKLFRFTNKDGALQNRKTLRGSGIRRNSSFTEKKPIKCTYSSNHLSVNQLTSLTPFLGHGDEIDKHYDMNECADSEVSNSGNKSILKRVYQTKMWNATKKSCNFMTVPDSCLGTECRSSFSSQNSTQVSSMSEDI